MSPRKLVLIVGLVASTSSFGQPCGTPWSVHAGPGPSPRESTAIAYDSSRGKVVLFGGQLGTSTLFGDTWEWTAAGPGGGGAWALASSTGPTPRAGMGMAYDSVRQRTVLFGGYTAFNSSSVTNETWEWDGSAWVLQSPVQSPPPMAPIMGFDPARARTIVVSTIYSGPESATTWEYDGTTWVRSQDSTPVSISGSIAFDSTRQRMSMLTTQPVALWERGESGWTLVPHPGPFDSFSGGLVFNSMISKLVVIDARSTSGASNLLAWDWSTQKWITLSSDGPPRLWSNAIAFDAAGGQVLSFGGRPVGGSSSNQTRLVRTDVRSGPMVAQVSPNSLYLQLRGAPGQLHVSATGSGTLTYQWRRNGIALSDGGSYQGAATPDLTIEPSATSITGRFDVRVLDSCGETVPREVIVAVSCYANCDGTTGNPIITASDFQCFLNQYASGSNYANCDGSTGTPALTANDFQCFLNRFAECSR